MMMVNVTSASDFATRRIRLFQPQPALGGVQQPPERRVPRQAEFLAQVGHGRCRACCQAAGTHPRPRRTTSPRLSAAARRFFAASHSSPSCLATCFVVAGLPMAASRRPRRHLDHVRSLPVT